jgi:2-polyprenyl-3-methyl-5-hydroxy-6-metoxy-1,4-benzoquinol methylase
MHGVEDYREVNRANWDERAPAHATSPDYNVQGYIDDPALIGHVVRFDQGLLGDLRGLRGLHLQCHIGTDTVGLSRLGAQMTGLDFSPAAIEQARAFVARSGDDVNFVESDVYDSVGDVGM